MGLWVINSGYAVLPCSKRSRPIISSFKDTLKPIVFLIKNQHSKDAGNTNAPAAITPISCFKRSENPPPKNRPFSVAMPAIPSWANRPIARVPNMPFTR